MSAATSNRFGYRAESDIVAYSGGSGFHYYKNTLVIKPGASAQTIRPLTATGASHARFLGVVVDEVDLSAGLGASQRTLDVWKTGVFTFAAQGTGISAHIGLLAYGVDDQTVGVSANSEYPAVGEIVGIPTSTSYRVRIDNAIGALGLSNIQQS